MRWQTVAHTTADTRWVIRQMHVLYSDLISLFVAKNSWEKTSVSLAAKRKHTSASALWIRNDLAARHSLIALCFYSFCSGPEPSRLNALWIKCKTILKGLFPTFQQGDGCLTKTTMMELWDRTKWVTLQNYRFGGLFFEAFVTTFHLTADVWGK